MNDKAFDDFNQKLKDIDMPESREDLDFIIKTSFMAGALSSAISIDELIKNGEFNGIILALIIHDIDQRLKGEIEFYSSMDDSTVH